MDSLPVEILHHILRPEYHDFVVPPAPSRYIIVPPGPSPYLSLRLVNRIFCAIVTPHVFEYQVSGASLDRLQLISESPHLANLVKRYTYGSPINISSAGYSPRSPGYSPVSPDSNSPPWIGSSPRANDTNESPIYTPTTPTPPAAPDLNFSGILPSLPNLRAITLNLCNPHYLDTTVFRALLTALNARTHTPIEDLTILGLSDPYLISAPTLTHPIKRLNLELGVYQRSRTPAPWTTTAGTLFNNLHSLESLTLTGDCQISWRPCCLHLSALIDTYHWPRLRTLTIHRLIFTSDILMSFLERHSDTIRSLSLWDSELRPPGVDETFSTWIGPAPDDPGVEDERLKELADLPEEVEDPAMWPSVFRGLRRLGVLEEVNVRGPMCGPGGWYNHISDTGAWREWALKRRNREPGRGRMEVNRRWRID